MDGLDEKPDERKRPARVLLARAIQRARGSLLWERLWPALATLATVAAFFLALSWAGLWIVLPPLARAVYRHVEPGDHIPVALYRACAEILAYVWKMQQWRRTGGKRPAPPKPQPNELDPVSKVYPVDV